MTNQTIYRFQCPKCGLYKVIDEYGVDRSRPDCKATVCLCCRAAAERARRLLRGPDRNRGSRLQRAAHKAVHYAIRKGKLVRPAACSKCTLERPRIVAHHHLGYAPEHRLHVQWLCEGCHSIVGYPDRRVA